MSAHVPAWKRLGLKLKNDNTITTATSPESASDPKDFEAKSANGLRENVENVAKRKRLDGDDQHVKTKKQKPHNDLSSRSKAGTTVPKPDHIKRSTEINENDAVSTTSPEPKTRKRQKSVSFSADTKTADGDSNETLAADQIIHEEKADQKHTETSIDKPTNGISTDKKSKDRKSKPQERTHIAYLDYLRQFHKDKAHWKFNKSKQNDVLKNILNIYRIPADYDDALVAYIQGLQGQMARDRLKDQAQQLIEELKKSTLEQLQDEDKASHMRTPSARANVYRLAESHELERLRTADKLTTAAEKEVRETAERRRLQDDRASLILSKALELDVSDLTSQKADKTAGAKELSARAKKRQRQKGRVDADSSSSDDSDGGSGKATEKTTNGTKVKISKSESSDSDSSSESSSSSEESSDDSSSSEEDDSSSEESESSDDDSSSGDSSSESEKEDGSDEAGYASTPSED